MHPLEKRITAKTGIGFCARIAGAPGALTPCCRDATSKLQPTRPRAFPKYCLLRFSGNEIISAKGLSVALVMQQPCSSSKKLPVQYSCRDVGMETVPAETPDAAVAAAQPWYLDVAAHRLYVQQHLQRGLQLIASDASPEEKNEWPDSAADGSAAAPPLPFIELQQHRQSLLSGVYWILCCLALLQPGTAALSPPAGDYHQAASLLPLPRATKETLVTIVLRCLRRHHFSTAATSRHVASRRLAGVPPLSGAAAAASASATTAMPAAETPTLAPLETFSTAATEAVAVAPSPSAPVAAATAVRRCSSAIGFSSNPTADTIAAAVPTCSGLQALALLEALPVLSEETLRQLRRFVLLLQRREDGAFANTLSPCYCTCCSGQAPTAVALPPGCMLEHEGDVRCTFSCLLSLKLIHAAAIAQRRDTASLAAFQASAGAASAASVAAVASARAESDIFSGRPVGGNASALFEAGCPHDDNWIAFLRDPFAGVRVEDTVGWLLSLVGPDGGVGVAPGVEAHAGAAFCFAGSLALLGRRDALGERQGRRLERCVLVPLLWLLKMRLLPCSCWGAIVAVVAAAASCTGRSFLRCQSTAVLFGMLVLTLMLQVAQGAAAA